MATWTELDRRARLQLPRFLFRGFHAASGGGEPDLNSGWGVVPHAFAGADGLASGRVSDLPLQTIRDMVDEHTLGERNRDPAEPYQHKSAFSSWSADFQTAVNFCSDPMKGWFETDAGSDGIMPGAHIGILDTNLLLEHNKVYHCPLLHDWGLIRGSRDYYDHEYLAYGTINEDAFHAVDLLDLVENHGFVTRPAVSGPPTDIAVAQARLRAENFQSPYARDRDQPDAIIAVTCADLARTQRAVWNTQDLDVRNVGDGDKVTFAVWEMMKIIHHLRWDIAQVTFGLDSNQGLVNPNMYTNNFPQLRMMKEALLDIEAHKRRLPRGARPDGYDINTPALPPPDQTTPVPPPADPPAGPDDPTKGPPPPPETGSFGSSTRTSRTGGGGRRGRPRGRPIGRRGVRHRAYRTKG